MTGKEERGDMTKLQKIHEKWYQPNIRTDLAQDLVHDGYTLTEEMIKKYRESQGAIPILGAIRPPAVRILKNVSIFDLSGRKITWGDLAAEDVKDMQGVYYVLSEYKSFWNPPDAYVKGYSPTSDDPNSSSPFRDLLPPFEPVVMDIGYIKGNAIARIVDGELQTSRELLIKNYQ